MANAFVVRPSAPLHVAFPSAARASNTARLLAPSYEALLEKLPSKSVIEVVEKSPDGKVIAAGMYVWKGRSSSGPE